MFLALVPCLAGQGALAQTTCTFGVECHESEACAESDFSADLSADASTIVTEFGDLDVIADHVGAAGYSVTATQGGAIYLMTISPDAQARLSVHMAGPVVVTYLGTCEESE